MTIVYADAFRAIHARAALREAGIYSTFQADVPADDSPDAARVALVTVSDDYTAKAVQVLKWRDLMGTVATPPSGDS
jgi:hypothetical protein